MLTLCTTAIAMFLFVGSAYAQAPDVSNPARVDIGGRFSIVAPLGPEWQTRGAPASYYKPLGTEGQGLLLSAVTGPSGISREDILSLDGPNAGNRLVKLVSRFVEQAWKAHAAGMKEKRFERIEVVNETGGKFSIGKFFCAYSRIRVRDGAAMIDGLPTHLRYVAYSCIEFSDMTVAADVSYSERGREQDLSDEAMAEGERFAWSLQRRP